MFDDVSSPTISSMGGPSREVIALSLAYARHGLKPRALDLGCGQGRNSIALSSVGADVTAVDTHSAPLELLRALSARYGRQVHTVLGNVADCDFEPFYDCILAHGILHYLSRSCVFNFITRMQSATAAGGYNVITICSFSEESNIIDDFVRDGFQNSIGSGELERCYSDWEIALHETYTKWDIHPGHGEHVHPIEKIVARKPNALVQPLIIGQTHKLHRSVREKEIASLIQMRSIIGLHEGDLRTKLGSPDEINQSVLDGAQLSLRGLVNTGYSLKLLFYGRCAVYVSNEVVSGCSLYESDFCDLRIA